jgi:hypothetical protein
MLLDISSAFTSSSQKKNLVKDSNYQQMNLAKNNIYICPFYKEFLEDITKSVNYVYIDCDSLGLT